MNAKQAKRLRRNLRDQAQSTPVAKEDQRYQVVEGSVRNRQYTDDTGKVVHDWNVGSVRLQQGSDRELIQNAKRTLKKIRNGSLKAADLG